MTAEDIETIVQESFKEVEQEHGKIYAEIVYEAWNCALAQLIDNAGKHNLHPGKLMNALIDVIVAIDRRTALIAKADALIALVEEQSALGQIN